MPLPLETARSAWESGDENTALKILSEIVVTNAKDDEAWKLIHKITARSRTLLPVALPPPSKNIPLIVRFVDHKRRVNVNIDNFSLDEIAHTFEVHWEGIPHYTFEFNSINDKAALFLPAAELSEQWLYIPLEQIIQFSQRMLDERMLDRHFIEIVFVCAAGSCTLGKTANQAAAQRWLDAANALLELRRKN